MGTYRLVPHPATPCPAVTAIDVEISRSERLRLTYRVSGILDAIRWPPTVAAVRADELWRHTCFEAFVAADASQYREFNFSPSGTWAAYAFDGYRDGMRAAEACSTSEIADGMLRVDVAFDLPGDWQLGLSAVIELLDGSRSYWALCHAPGPPDFHNRDCFTATLAAPERP